MKFSKFGNRFTRYTGARQLMDDLGEAMSSEESVMMLGGGNPAHIPEVLALLAQRTADIAADPREFRRMVADYASPAGEERFRRALAELLNREYGWGLGPENVALTAGSQNGFFHLFNILAGEFDDGSFGQILLPLTPEYAGYADLGLSDNLFVARKPLIEHMEDHLFKYHVDFGQLKVDENIAAICVSRPTNPTGNVLTDDEIRKLAALARQSNVPLILDSAYGLPFPGIVFRDIEPFWDDNVILCLSLSKIGLPAVRTGIIIAREEVIEAITSVNAVASLAVGSVGPVLMRELIETGRIVELSRDIVGPFYHDRSAQALDLLHAALEGCGYHVHRPEGAFFLWLWIPELGISCQELYLRLKKRGVYILPGHHFFPGLTEEWAHRDQCIRISYSQDIDAVRRGIEIIGEEIKTACS